MLDKIVETVAKMSKNGAIPLPIQAPPALDPIKVTAMIQELERQRAEAQTRSVHQAALIATMQEQLRLLAVQVTELEKEKVQLEKRNESDGLSECVPG